LDVRRAIIALQKPFLAIHGTTDETLPISMLHDIKAWNQNVEIIEMPKVNHTFGSKHPHIENVLPRDLNIAADLITNFFKITE
jgi:pimeloyl-ACP methyl ester carboxylesterase